METISKKTTAQRLREFRDMQKVRDNSANNIIETALFLEDVFGITLSDKEMEKEHIGPETDVTAFVLKKRLTSRIPANGTEITNSKCQI